MTTIKSLLSVLLLISCAQGCGPVTVYEEEYDRAVLLYVDYFNVPDSSTQQSLRVTIRGSFGGTNAFRFDRINTVRTDSLFVIAVWGREVSTSGTQYTPQDVRIDTILSLNTPRKGLHLVNLLAAQGVLVDTTTVY
jgi:hypothetical protein